ncbi:mannose-6-phosphate isomerase, class I [Selenihalanaerobacter shriftii]|uniref:mannose-6-phosphate isomerase n=1 Tax=Selenihalanaerobacter shriftii TaxID=142842 RepID=A0A1T4QI91_9FIRM|nr:mannose-6-phosphate isomerase, class I [Selenihalanaerobacter shriftii]SKA03429.1 mannose-6-phosphate isomerase, type 1 [Selenihalanaerobacter shriftii]
MFYPLKFKPIYKEKIWGGNNIATYFNRNLPKNKIGESWELAAHKNGTSIVNNGRFKDKSLTELINKYWIEIMGTRIKEEDHDRFPLLIKILDANDKLSVQVHPDDEYAAEHEDGELGKTEMWYILDAEPGAELIYGLKPGVTKEEFKVSIEDGSLVDKLNRIKVKKGDILFIPTGTIHSIKEGVLLAEIQQNSDTTYRVFDWNRVGDDGQPRKLHIKEALDVVDFNRDDYKKSQSVKYENNKYQRKILTTCEYFTCEKLLVEDSFSAQPQGKRFEVLLCLDGKGIINYENGKVNIKGGETILIPAVLDEYKIEGEVEVLRSYIGEEL